MIVHGFGHWVAGREDAHAHPRVMAEARRITMEIGMIRMIGAVLPVAVIVGCRRVELPSGRHHTTHDRGIRTARATGCVETGDPEVGVAAGPLSARQGPRSGAPLQCLRMAFERNGDSGLESTFGSVREVREYIQTWRGFYCESSRTPRETDGLALFRWYHSPEYEASERRIHRELIPHISIDSLGHARWHGIHRRNARMVEFAEADIVRLGARRVLIIVGSGHKFDLEDIFRARGFQVIASSAFQP